MQLDQASENVTLLSPAHCKQSPEHFRITHQTVFRNMSSNWREPPCVLLEIWNILIRFRRLEEIRSPRSTKLQLSCSPVSSCLFSSKNWEILSNVQNEFFMKQTFIKQLYIHDHLFILIFYYRCMCSYCLLLLKKFKIKNWRKDLMNSKQKGF